MPGSWDHFAVENVPYHGHNLSVLWDRDGSRYGQGAGLRIWIDGEAGAPAGRSEAGRPAGEDGAAAVAACRCRRSGERGRAPAIPRPRPRYTWPADTPADAIDGQDFHLDVPTTRWTSYGSPNREDWLAVDLGAAKPVSDLRLSFYDDGGGVRTPDEFAVEYRNAAGQWVSLPGQTRVPPIPERGRLNRVLVDPPVTTNALRVRPIRTDGGAVGITAFQSWR